MLFDESKDQARKSLEMEERLIQMHNAYSAIERCRWPVLVGVDGACFGAGVDMITACDIVYCTKKAFFSIKEVDNAMTADLGTMQRLPIITGNWYLMKEYALTGERILPDEASKLGLVSRVFENDRAMKNALFRVAELISSKSPIAIIGIKHTINRPRNRVVEEGLIDVRRSNMSQLFTDDLAMAVQATLTKTVSKFQKL